MGSIKDNCYSTDHIAEDNIHTDITCNIEEPQQKYRLGTASNRLLRWEGGGLFTDSEAHQLMSL